jgi:hypothetical protein
MVFMSPNLRVDVRTTHFSLAFYNPQQPILSTLVTILLQRLLNYFSRIPFEISYYRRKALVISRSNNQMNVVRHDDIGMDN